MPTVKLSGNEFGETYHVAAAMLATPLLPAGNVLINNLVSAINEQNAQSITNAQKTFFAYIQASGLVGTVNSSGFNISKAVCSEDIIAPAFAQNPRGALNRLRNGFFANFKMEESLGQKQLALAAFLSTNSKPNLQRSPGPVNPKAVIWIRNIAGETRNMTTELIRQIVDSLSASTNSINEIIFVGDANIALPPQGTNQIFYNLIEFFNKDSFINISGAKGNVGSDFTFSTQLLTFWVLYKTFQVKMIIGMKSGAMDGPTFIGIPTIFFDDDSGNGSPTRMSTLAEGIPWMKRVTFPSNAYNSNDAKYSIMPPETVAELGNAITAIQSMR